MRIKLVVAYDGTGYGGWAAQTGRETVQGTLTEAVRQISGEESEITGASRTDGGAHAQGQVCHFDTERPVPIEKWPQILNRRLPSDIAILSANLVPNDFHSRFWAMDRTYRYRILIGSPDPFRACYTHGYHRPLDVAAMSRVAKILQGDHDFRAFSEELDPTVQNTRRLLRSVQVKQVRDEVWVDVVGTAFMRGMMRRMAGVLLEVGRAHRPVEEVSRLLEPEERSSLQWPVVLPACGLCLMRVRYGRHPKAFPDSA